MCSSVFFQAEDGIRDIGVTGVQTCALPISLVRDERPLTEHVHLAFGASEHATVRAFHAAALAAGYEDHGAPGERAVYHRSEERRVGKECRSRRSPYH